MAIDTKKLFNEDLKGALERNPDQAKKIGGVYQLNVNPTGSWAIDLNSDKPSVVEGQATNPQVTIELAEPDFQTLYSNPNEGMKLFFAGKLKVKGNQTLALKLQQLFALK